MDTNVEAADGRSASTPKSKSNRQPLIRAEWEDKKLLQAASRDPLVMLVLTGKAHAARCAAGSGAAAAAGSGAGSSAAGAAAAGVRGEHLAKL